MAAFGGDACRAVLGAGVRVRLAIIAVRSAQGSGVAGSGMFSMGAQSWEQQRAARVGVLIGQRPNDGPIRQSVEI